MERVKIKCFMCSGILLYLYRTVVPEVQLKSCWPVSKIHLHIAAHHVPYQILFNLVSVLYVC